MRGEKKKSQFRCLKGQKKRENKYLYLFSTGTVYTALRSAYKSGIRHRNDWTIKIFASLLNNWNNYENNVFNLIICDCLYLALNKRWNVNFNKYICCGSTMKLSTVSPVSKCTFVNMGGGMLFDPSPFSQSSSPHEARSGLELQSEGDWWSFYISSIYK